jgi:hypothetical protein
VQQPDIPALPSASPPAEVAVAALITRDAKPVINSNVTLSLKTPGGIKTVTRRTDSEGKVLLPREAVAVQIGRDVAAIPADAVTQGTPLEFALERTPKLAQETPVPRQLPQKKAACSCSANDLACNAKCAKAVQRR